MGTATTANPPKRAVIDREAFKEKFGHPYVSVSIGGHAFYSYNCKHCGLHISLARRERAWKAECMGNFPGIDLPEFAHLKRGVPEDATGGQRQTCVI